MQSSKARKALWPAWGNVNHTITFTKPRSHQDHTKIPPFKRYYLSHHENKCNMQSWMEGKALVISLVQEWSMLTKPRSCIYHTIAYYEKPHQYATITRWCGRVLQHHPPYQIMSYHGEPPYFGPDVIFRWQTTAQGRELDDVFQLGLSFVWLVDGIGRHMYEDCLIMVWCDAWKSLYDKGLLIIQCSKLCHQLLIKAGRKKIF